MKRISTLFRVVDGRLTDEPYGENSKQILDGNPHWVPRRKWNGIAALYSIDERWYLRRAYRSDQVVPEGFTETGHSYQRDGDGEPRTRWGWIPVECSPYPAAMRAALLRECPRLIPGSTYELCGPRIARNGNTEGFTVPTLIRHADSDICVPLQGHASTFESLKRFFTKQLADAGWEGIVWEDRTHPGRMMKLRVANFV